MGNNNTAVAKCPTCRCEFRLQDIKRDDALKNQMQHSTKTVVCQYQGCHEQLYMHQVALHEQTCLFLPLKCRFATFGCEWKGTRQTLQQHEATCPLMQISQLVEQFRQTRAHHEQVLNQLQARVCYCCMWW